MHLPGFEFQKQISSFLSMWYNYDLVWYNTIQISWFRKFKLNCVKRRINWKTRGSNKTFIKDIHSYCIGRKVIQFWIPLVSIMWYRLSSGLYTKKENVSLWIRDGVFFLFPSRFWGQRHLKIGRQISYSSLSHLMRLFSLNRVLQRQQQLQCSHLRGIF